MKIEVGPSLERGRRGVWSKMREFIVSCSRINQTKITKCFHLGEDKLFILKRLSAAGVWSCENCSVLSVYFPPGLLALAWSHVWSMKSGWLCCHCKTQWRNLLSTQLCNLPFFSYHFRVEIMFMTRRNKRWHMRTSSGIWIQQYFYFIEFFLHYQEHKIEFC